MADNENGLGEEELLDYEEEEVQEQDGAGAAAKGGDQAKKGYVGIHSSGFKDLMLKPELLRAITDCGFEHPSEGMQTDGIEALRRPSALRDAQRPAPS